jgi:hypothetical protein
VQAFSHPLQGVSEGVTTEQQSSHVTVATCAAYDVMMWLSRMLMILSALHTVKGLWNTQQSGSSSTVLLASRAAQLAQPDCWHAATMLI